MVCSPEQLASNRRNSKLSKGPKTPEGKSKSRRNGLKHGLTGAGVVIADEDVEAVQDRIEAFEADLKPANDVARFLANRAALLSVRLDRSAREEAARINREMLLAAGVEEDQRAEQFERLLGSLGDHPVESVRKLRRSEEGIDWLLEWWREARHSLREEGAKWWSSANASRLTGRRLAAPREARLSALGWAVMGQFHELGDSDWPDLPPLERQAAAKAELTEFVDREIADLEAAREGLDRERIAQVRAGAAARALFPTSPEANLARKYEAAAAREFYRALQQIERINEAAEEEVEANPKPEETCEELGSSFPEPEPGASRAEVIQALDRQAVESRGRRGEQAGSRGKAGRTRSDSHPKS
jgi:hypothetical protein